jgi:hypothetical protein
MACPKCNAKTRYVLNDERTEILGTRCTACDWRDTATHTKNDSTMQPDGAIMAEKTDKKSMTEEEADGYEFAKPMCSLCGGELRWRKVDTMLVIDAEHVRFSERQLDCLDCGAHAVTALFPHQSSQLREERGDEYLARENAVVRRVVEPA